MVDSVDDSKSSHSIQGYTHFPNFEMLDARIASALNRIIQNSYFKKKVLECQLVLLTLLLMSRCTLRVQCALDQRQDR